MELKWKLHAYTFKPGAYITTETRAIMGVKRGTFVAGVFARLGEAFNGTTPTISVGDVAGAVDGFMLTTNITYATPGLYAGYGSYFSAANGHLYTADDTIDLVYTYNTGTTTGLVTIYIVYCEME